VQQAVVAATAVGRQDTQSLLREWRMENGEWRVEDEEFPEIFDYSFSILHSPFSIPSMHRLQL
jgi:hypothetical protein